MTMSVDKLQEKLDRWFVLYTRTAKTRKEAMLYNEMKQCIKQQQQEIERLRTIEQAYNALRSAL